ncbi:outer membrane beta-barrel protein [Lysobacter sp. GX 14042]|uniref:OmpW/AlkL family protein n=1 Tax=Lysobacter sp. GX 14042 TaxID=2907155 RepID=UPI001F27A769|nr:OmpW family outer membrane protein [Lysobacter sp. GX 14042]MCE7033060.1 outer membrane beta-barrel protein [Lysobacter sp. GX 14042]
MKRINLTLALLGAIAIVPAAMAQEAPDHRFAVVGGYALSEPTGDASIAGGKADLDGEGAATLSASWYATDNIAIEAWGTDKFGHRVNGPNGKAGSVDAQPYALSGQYHFGTSEQTVRPYVGLGYYEMNYDGETVEATGPLAGQRLGVETAKGAMATVGADVKLSDRWFVRGDVRYLHGDSDLSLDGEKVGKADTSPVIVGLGVGARF